MQNFHRYFLRLSYLVWAVLAYDALKSFWFENGFGIGVGTIVLTVKSCSSPAMSLDVTRSGTWWAGPSIASRSIRSATSFMTA